VRVLPLWLRVKVPEWQTERVVRLFLGGANRIESAREQIGAGGERGS